MEKLSSSFVLILSCFACVALSFLTASCGSSDNQIPLTSAAENGTNNAAASHLLAEARSLQSQGKNDKAIGTYQDVSKKYPRTEAAADARFAEGNLLYKEGDLLKAFEAYQDLIANYPRSQHYSPALKRQQAVALDAAEGVIKNNFLGLKTKINPARSTKMLANVRDNAPQAPSASIAQYHIGRVWQNNGNAHKALSAYLRISADYPNSSQAPEALYQRGQILIMKADKGNQNSAHLNQAKSIFQDLIERYPNNKRASDARKSISKLAGQDIQRSYDTAEFYRKKGNYDSAIFYYKEVTRKSKSGNLYNLATARLSELSQ